MRTSKFSKNPALSKRDGSLASFTLIEMLTSVVLMLILLAVISVVINSVTKAYLAQRSQVQTFQSGRNALDMLVRDLGSLEPPHVSSQNTSSQTPPNQFSRITYLQFIQDAGDPGNPTQPLNAFTSPFQQVPYSSSIFGQVRGPSTSFGNLYIVGYYLARTADRKEYDLMKYFVSPVQMQGGVVSQNPYYMLYTSTVLPGVTNNYPQTPAWLYLSNNPTAFQANSYVVAKNVVALWFRCLDNGNQPIPWLSTSVGQSVSAPFKFNSSSCFVMSPLIGATNQGNAFTYFSPAPTAQTSTNFFYQPITNSLAGNRLPPAIEVTAITMDSQSIARLALLPVDFATNTPITSPLDIPVAASNYLYNLPAVYKPLAQSARIFSTVVHLQEDN